MKAMIIILNTKSIVIDNPEPWVEEALIKSDAIFANIDGHIRIQGDNDELYKILQMISLYAPKSKKWLRFC